MSFALGIFRILAQKCNFVDFNDKVSVCIRFCHIYEPLHRALGLFLSVFSQFYHLFRLVWIQFNHSDRGIVNRQFRPLRTVNRPGVLCTGPQDILLRSYIGSLVANCVNFGLNPPKVGAFF